MHVPTADDRESMADVGVLLVHGIGDHTEGDTLLSFGEPLLDWLREWLSGARDGRPRGRVDVTRARLRADRDEGASPAFARACIADDAGGREHWLFAEAWWGDSVKVPGQLALLGWMFTRLPLLVLWHLFGGHDGADRADDAAQRIEPQRAPRLWWNTPVPAGLVLAAKALLAPLLILGMQCVVLVAALLSLVPFGPWRQAVLTALRVMTLTLGDSYVLLEQDIQRAALTERVRRSLGWLQARSRRVVVVAHSQGGALAHDALQSGAPVEAFISVGSGLEKLEFLRLVRERRSGLVAASLAAPALALGLAGLLSGWLDWVERGTGWWVGPAVLLALAWVAIVYLVRCLGPYRGALRQELEQSALLHASWGGRWSDVYATLDLVPMGRASMLPARPQLQRVELRNECSLISDHVRYFDSRNGFAAWLWGELARFSSLRLLVGTEAEQLKTAGRWHARRAFGLGFGGGLLPLTLVFGALLFTDLLSQMGAALLQALAASDLGWTRRALQGLVSGLARLIGALPGFDNTPAALERRGQVLVAIGAAGAGLALWSLAIVQWWRIDSRGRWRALCRRESTLLGSAAVWFGTAMALFWCLAAMLPLLALLVVARSPELLSFGAIGRAMASIAGALLLMMVVVGLAAMAFMGDTELEDGMLHRRLRWLWPLVASAGAGLWALLASEAWRIGSGERFTLALWLALAGTAAVLWASAVSWQQRHRPIGWLVVWGPPLAAGAALAAASVDAAWVMPVTSALLLMTAGAWRARSLR